MDALVNAAMGLAGESGEAVELVKKYHSVGREFTQEKMMEELGGVLWYIAEMCDACGITMQQCAEYNVAQLRKRHGKTFTGHGNRDTATGGA